MTSRSQFWDWKREKNQRFFGTADKREKDQRSLLDCKTAGDLALSAVAAVAAAAAAAAEHD